MELSELDYELPPELIAQHPAERRDAGTVHHCRAMGYVAAMLIDNGYTVHRRTHCKSRRRTTVGGGSYLSAFADGLALRILHHRTLQHRSCHVVGHERTGLRRAQKQVRARDQRSCSQLDTLAEGCYTCEQLL